MLLNIEKLSNITCTVVQSTSHLYKRVLKPHLQTVLYEYNCLDIMVEWILLLPYLNTKHGTNTERSSIAHQYVIMI